MTLVVSLKSAYLNLSKHVAVVHRANYNQLHCLPTGATLTWIRDKYAHS